MKTTAETAKRHAVDIDFLLRQANLAAQVAEYGAPTLETRLKAQKLKDATGRLRGLAKELAQEMGQ